MRYTLTKTGVGDIYFEKLSHKHIHLNKKEVIEFREWLTAFVKKVRMELEKYA